MASLAVLQAREYARRVKAKADELLHDEHEKQAAFVADRSRRIGAHCGRRSGKSYGIAKRLARTALMRPEGMSVFIAISASRSIEIMSRGMTLFSNRHDLGAKMISMHGQTFWRFPNGHRIWCAGCKNRSDAAKFRGDPYCATVVDEADSMRGHLQYLVEDCLDPALMDERGWLALTGTPGVTPAGYFWERTTGQGELSKWPSYCWTALDNPYLPHAEQELAERRRDLGLTEDSPTYRREWLGQWVRDLESLCYPYDPVKNRIDGPLEVDSLWRYAMGVDLGITDATAFAAIAYKRGLPDIRIVEAQSWTRLILSRAAAYVKQWRQPDRYPGAAVVPDTGGMGKAYAEEWAQEHGIPYEPARKSDVAGQIATMGGLLRTGQLKLHFPACRELAAEMSILPWNEKRTGPDPAYPNDLSDAARYGTLAVRTVYRPEEDTPKPGTPEWDAQVDARERQAALAKAAERQARRSRQLVRSGFR